MSQKVRFSVLLLLMNSVFNFMIYTYRSKEFKGNFFSNSKVTAFSDEFKALLTCKRAQLTVKRREKLFGRFFKKKQAESTN